MSLAELLPSVHALPNDEKRRLMQVLADDLSLDTDTANVDPDFDLTSEEREARNAGIARGDADFEAGRFRSLDQVKADKRTRFGLPV